MEVPKTPSPCKTCPEGTKKAMQEEGRDCWYRCSLFQKWYTSDEERIDRAVESAASMRSNVCNPKRMK